MQRFRVAKLDDIEEITDGSWAFRPVRHHLGISTFGVNAMVAKRDGQPLINEHEHDEAEPESSEELYAVMSGAATFEVDDETVDAPAGTFLRVSAGVKRSAVAQTAGTTVLVIGGAPAGKPYEVSGWELFTPLFPLFDSEEYAEGADRAQALIADDPPYGYVYFNTACFESLAARIDDAIVHLKRAVELTPAFKALARDDEDFAPLHAHPAWPEIISD